MAALDNLSYFCAISNDTQHAICEMLEDKAWLAGYVKENNARLARSYGLLTAALRAAHIPFVPAAGAMFAWIDLRRGLREASWSGEAELWQAMIDEARVLLTPGECCHADEPGFFRVCWSWVPPEALPIAVQRIAKLLAARGVGGAVGGGGGEGDAAGGCTLS